MINAHGRVTQKYKMPPPQAKQTTPKLTPLEQLEEALGQRDFSKATSMLEFYESTNQALGDLPINAWLAYAAFHMGDYAKSIEAYKRLLALDDSDSNHYVHLACCYYCAGQYKEAEEAALKGPPTALQNRLLMHIAHKTNEEGKLMACHGKIQSTVEDQLSLAAIHYFRNHYQEAIDVYKRVLLQVREYLALNVYVALCYHKLDFYDVCGEVLNVYLQPHSDSAVAINLKACNSYRLYNGKSAEQELKVLIDMQATAYNIENDIVKHNLVVFRGGEDALKVLPPLVNLLPEARLNLVVYHLKNDQLTEAHELLKDLQPATPPEYILKAIVNACIGQQLDSQDHLKMAQRDFQLVGASKTECDTIPGRQCMASCFFMLRHFDDVMLYLRSVRDFFQNDDTFLYMFGITLCATGGYAEAEDQLLLVKADSFKAEFSYISWLARAHIMNRHAKKAWDMYLKMDTNAESFSLLQLIANDCYRAGSFYFAAKAFDVLERLDGAQEYWDGKKGACAGVMQQCMAGKEPADSFWDVVKLVETSAQLHQGEKPQAAQEAENMVRVMKDWAKDHGLKRR